MNLDPRQNFLTAVEKTHGRRLQRYLAARLRNASADVSDLAQEVYLRLLRVPDHETIRNPQAYLYTIASHVLHQHGLKRTATPELVDIQDTVEDLPQGLESDPAAQVETEQRFERLGEGLLAHSPRAYATLVLHRCNGVPLQEIADRFGVSYTMVKRYLAKALVYCQQHLENEDRDVP